MTGNIFANDHCRFEISRGAIPRTSEQHAVQSIAKATVLPDMFFSGSGITVRSPKFDVQLGAEAAAGCYTIVPDMTYSKWESINPPTLKSVDPRKSLLGNLKVKHSARWQLDAYKRNLLSCAYPANYDWAFTTTYWGSITPVAPVTKPSEVIGEACRDDFLPVNLLRDTSIPIRFHHELPFWEDELAENGHSGLSVRLRVMDDFFFILMSVDLRIEGVLNSRRLETRIFHSFDSRSVLREFRWIENGIDTIPVRVQQTINIG